MSDATDRETRVITLLAETFLHPGTGQSTGVVDLPVQREVHTGFPMIQSTGLKGSLRDLAGQRGIGPDIIRTIFGTEVETAGADKTVAGALTLTDARILAFPVRSLQHVFVWITCPMVLTRLKRDLALAGIPCSIPDKKVTKEKCKVAKDGFFDSPLVLEEISLEIEEERINGIADEIAKRCPNDQVGEAIKERLVLISDEDFKHFVTYATQVSARIQLTEEKTSNNLWYEETLPPETLMYALALANNPRNGGAGSVKTAAGVMEKIKTDLFPNGKIYIQIGGNETVGQGWCSVKISNGGTQ